MTVEEQLLEFCETPQPRHEIYRALDYEPEEIHNTIREMLYDGQMTTTPDWRYVKV